jgi:glycosyltransferase involved in cell wall biosynthesis
MSDQRRPRLIFAWNYIEWGGAQIFALALIKRVRAEFDVLVVLPIDSSEQLLELLQKNSIQYRFFAPAAHFGPTTNLKERIKQRWLKRRSEFALVNAVTGEGLERSIVNIELSPHQSLFAIIRLCRRSPVFFIAHNSAPPAGWREPLWKLKSFVISKFKHFHIFAANHDAKGYFARFFNNRVGNRIPVVAAGIDTVQIEEAFTASVSRHEELGRIGSPTDKFTVLTVGQFIDRKGRWILLEAAKQVLEKHPDVIFLWLMPRLPDEEETERIRGYGLGDSFRPVLSGSVGVTRQEILRFFRVADLFVLPSFLEGLPISLLEAMSLGIPSISTNVNAIPEAIIDGETGVLIQPGDPDALARGIISLKEDSAMSKRIADTGREFVLKNFDERIAAEKALEMYKKALGMSERDVDIPKG